MRVIPVDVSAATLLVTKLPEVKVKDRQTGEIAVDPVTNDRLMVMELVFIAAGGSDMIKVTVPEKGIGEGLVMGAPVILPGLIARPWESEFGGRMRHGIAYRADAVMVNAPAPVQG
ncbi:SCO3933 family regulatory protein [Streptomyces antibioticus]|uniref:SCO3933 family regulatory protein n=1 Tax=Streptomyces antibioticus TaxID=1890 RepID=UPI003F480841